MSVFGWDVRIRKLVGSRSLLSGQQKFNPPKFGRKTGMKMLAHALDKTAPSNVHILWIFQSFSLWSLLLSFSISKFIRFFFFSSDLFFVFLSFFLLCLSFFGIFLSFLFLRAFFFSSMLSCFFFFLINKKCQFLRLKKKKMWKYNPYYTTF